MTKYLNEDRVYIIGEIGINHNGDLDTALKLIDVAKAAGCDAVKFQKRTIDVVYSAEELARPRESVFGKTNGDLKRGLEFDRNTYAQIINYCRIVGIDFGVSCWDDASIDFFADELRPDFLKVASASITDLALMEHTRKASARLDCPIIMSTGGSTHAQISRACETLGSSLSALLHCVSEYPCPVERCNLSMIETLRDLFGGMTVGYSGHETGIAPTLAAVAMGARVIERHITLDRAMWGSDQSASLEPVGLARMCRDIRAVEAAMGDGVKRITEGEAACMAKLRRVQS